MRLVSYNIGDLMERITEHPHEAEIGEQFTEVNHPRGMIKGTFRNTFEMCIDSPMHILNIEWCLANFFQIIFGLDAALQVLECCCYLKVALPF